MCRRNSSLQPALQEMHSVLFSLGDDPAQQAVQTGDPACGAMPRLQGNGQITTAMYCNGICCGTTRVVCGAHAVEIIRLKFIFILFLKN